MPTSTAVVAAVAKFVNMRGVDDAVSGDGGKPVGG
jgi:hypothetical protein